MSKVKILIAEDEKVMREMLVDYLSMFDYEIDQAENGKVAWEKWNQAKYNLVVSDINMPEMSGIDLLKNIKTADNTFPVILITGVTIEKARKSAEDYKADAFLSKPFKIKELLATIEEVLGI